MNKWAEDILSKKVDLIHGHQFRDNDFVKDGFPIVKIGQLSQNGELDLSNCSFVSRNEFEIFKEYCIYKGDILMALTGATLGKTVRVKKNYGTIFQNYRVGKFQPIDTSINKDFLYYLLTSENIQREMLLKINSAAQGNIGKADFEKIKIKYPEYNFQEKIGKILTTTDGVIEKTQAAIAKYKAIKQGMLQDLFTRGIDITTNKLRPLFEVAPHLYKESKLGMIPREWEVLPIASVSENLDGTRIPVKQEDRDKQQEIYPYYGASGIIDYVEDYIFDEPLILLGEDGENVISRNLPLAFKVEGKIWVNNHAHVLRPIKSITTIDYLSEVLESINYSTVVSGTAQPKITQGSLSTILLPIPNIDEQIVMSERIVSINNKLQTEQTYLQKMQSLKKGLMEDLLSGKRLVNVDESETQENKEYGRIHS